MPKGYNVPPQYQPPSIGCPTCSGPATRGLNPCDDCLVRQIDEAYPFFDGRRRGHAREMLLEQFVDCCPTHGIVRFWTKTGNCVDCTKSDRGPDSDRAAARREGKPHFYAVCEEHGNAKFSVLHGKCLMCFTTAGLSREGLRVISAARAAARRQGAATYLATCEVHGQDTAHHTQIGKCAKCYTTAGVARVKPLD